MKQAIAYLVAALFSVAASATIYETNDLQRANLKTVEEWTKAQGAAANSGEIVVERALRLDKKAGEVVVLAEFCGIDPAATIEFPIVGETSDRDYESLFRTFARPGAIARAIEALGVPRGANVDGRTMNFWPRGERISIEVAPFGATNATYEPIQKYIVDMQTRAPVAYDSFVYCGSPDDPASKDGTRLCDAEAPNSVFSTYNEPQTVIDMPAVCPQSDVYERFLLSPTSGLKPFGLYTLRFRPAKKAGGEGRVRNYTLQILKGAEYDLVLDGAKTHYKAATDLLLAVRDVVKSGFDPFVSVVFDDAVTLDEAIAQAQMIGKIEGENGIRVVGPSATSVYYKGFLPNKSWRIAKDRPSQPWEVHFGTSTNGVREIRMVKTLEDWTSTDSLDPILTSREFTVKTPEEMLSTMEANDHGLPVVLVFAKADDPLSVFMPAVRLLKSRHPTVYFFAE